MVHESLIPRITTRYLWDRNSDYCTCSHHVLTISQYQEIRLWQNATAMAEVVDVENFSLIVTFPRRSSPD